MDHFYKGFLIRSIPVPSRKRKMFRLYPFLGRGDVHAVDATLTLTSAKKLIDIWELAIECACGRPTLPYNYRCTHCQRRHCVGLMRKV